MTGAIFGDQYLATEKTVLNVAERKFTLSGDSFDVKDENDKKIFFADGNAFRAKRMIRLLDSTNKKKVLATVGKDLDGNGYYLKKGETNQVLFHYKPTDDFAAGQSVSGKVELYKGGSAYPAFYVARILDNKTYALMDAAEGTEVGRITHDFQLGNRDIWTCSVPTGSDLVLLVATTILIDEILETFEGRK